MPSMLVAYRDCGCRVMALVNDDYPGTVEEFRKDCRAEGLTCRWEAHARIGALQCHEHRPESVLDAEKAGT